MIPAESESRCKTADAFAFACLNVMCGGSGGASGSVWTSLTPAAAFHQGGVTPLAIANLTKPAKPSILSFCINRLR